MKKLKLLTSLAGFVTLSSVIAPVLTSCGCTKAANDVIPTDLLEIEGTTLKGFKEDADISKYKTLEIPSSVRIIDEYAFCQLYVDYSHIQKLIVPNSVKEIKKYAFAGLTSLLEIDLSNLDTDNAHRIEIESNIFGIYNKYFYCPIKLSSSLSKVAKAYLMEKLMAAGVPESWFTLPTSGHLTFSGDKEVENDGNKPVEYSAELTTIPTSGISIQVYLQKTGGTDGVDVLLDTYELNNNAQSGKNLTFNATLDVENNHKLAKGDNVVYRAVVMAKSATTTKWVETIDNLKLTYNGDGNIAMTSIVFDTPDMDVRLKDEIVITPTIYPKSCTDKTLKWTTSDPTIATVKDGVVYTTMKAGEVTITATSPDGKVSASVTFTSVADISMFDFYPTCDGYDDDGAMYDNGEDGYIAYPRWDYSSKELEELEAITIPETYKGKYGEMPIIGVEYYDGNQMIGEYQPFKNVKEVYIGKNVRFIGYGAFYDFESLESVKFDEKTQCWYIDDYAFEDTNISSITLPESVVSVGKYAFYDTPLWEGDNWIEPDANNPFWYLKLGDNPYALAWGTSYDREAKEDWEITINPECELIANDFLNHLYGVNYGEEEEFYDEISSITFGNKLRGIGDYAFTTNLLKIDELKMPSSLKYIGRKSFFNFMFNGLSEWEASNDFYIKSLKLNEGLKWINEGAFASADYQYSYNEFEKLVTIPSTVEALGLKEFGYYYGGSGIPSYFSRPKSPLINSDIAGVFANCCFYNDIKYANNSQLKILGTDTFNYVYANDYDSILTIPNSVEILCPGCLAIYNEGTGSIYSWLDYKGYGPDNPYTITIPASVELMQYPFFNSTYYRYFIKNGRSPVGMAVPAGLIGSDLYDYTTYPVAEEIPVEGTNNSLSADVNHEYTLRLAFADQNSPWYSYENNWIGPIEEGMGYIGIATYKHDAPKPGGIHGKADSEEFNYFIYENYFWNLCYDGYSNDLIYFKPTK